jgi:hypothetical protein
MATLETLHEHLTGAANLLDDAAHEIRNIPFEPTNANIRRIGEILVQIFDLQREIYRLRPELIPTHLWDVRGANADPSPAIIVQGALRRIDIARKSGDVPMAIQLLEFLLRTQPEGEHVGQAQALLRELNSERP